MMILEVNKLTKDFGGLRALENIDLNVSQGEIFGVIGPNGSGKTTLFNILTGFLKPTAGQAIFKKRVITGLRSHQIAKLGIGRVFQINSLFPNLSVRENMIRSRFLRMSNTFLESFFRTKGYWREELELDEKVNELLSFVELERKTDVLAKNLPFGEQRKLEIAMALGAEPELLFLDEPATGMNPSETLKVMRLIQSIQQKGITLLVVEHNMKVIMGICTRIAVISFGVKIAESVPEEISKNKDVISVYLGTRRRNA